MLKIKKIEFSELNIPFNVTFSHASASRESTQSIWVKVATTRGLTGYGEGCPREYVTGESLESVKRFIEKINKSICKGIHSLDDLKAWVIQNETDIDVNPAAWCAVELAILDVIAQSEGCVIETLLDIPTAKELFTYTAILGNNALPSFEKQFNQYQEMGFEQYKVKLSGNYKDDKARLDLLFNREKTMRVRVDANNLWNNKEAVIDYFRLLDQPIEAIEEPMIPGQYGDLRYIYAELAIPVILDESFCSRTQFIPIIESPHCWILNIRVSKMGGLIRTIEIINTAESFAIPIIIGAHVGETSLLTRAGLVAARAAQKTLIAQEGGFGTYLLKYDICDEPLQFKKKGKLNFPTNIKGDSGFGIKIKDVQTE